MSIATGISATKTGFDLIKSATELLRRPSLDPSEVHARLLELQALLLEAQRALGEAEEENRILRRTLDEEKAARKTTEKMVFASHVYWLRKDAGGLDGPYCTICWDDSRKLVRMTFTAEGTFAGKEELGRCRAFTCGLHDIKAYLPATIFTDTIQAYC